MKMFDLTGKTAIVTGGGTGLGEAISKALAEAGAALVLSGRRPELINKIASEIRSKGGKAISVPTDVTKRDDVKTMLDRAIKEFGKVDILVNNAGINIVKPFLKISEQEWDTVLNTNLKGCFYCCQAVGKLMVEQRSGSVINMVSVFGLRGFMNLGPYLASKGAIVQLTKGLAIEWAKYNVRVNAIAPSYIETEMTKRDIESDERILQYNLSKIPMKRGGKPEELGGIAVFLASEASSFITGEIIAVDGGWLAL